MRKIYITKEDLINEIETVKDRLDSKPVGPIAYLIVLIGVVFSLILLIPIVLLWLILIIMYIPGFLLDNLILKFLYKGKHK